VVDIDLEKPYQDTLEEGELFDHYANIETKELWYSFQTESKASEFVDDYISDPNGMLAKVIQIVAEAQDGIAYNPGEAGMFRRLAYNKISFLLDGIIRPRAESIAEMRMESGAYEEDGR